LLRNGLAKPNMVGAASKRAFCSMLGLILDSLIG